MSQAMVGIITIVTSIMCALVSGTKIISVAKRSWHTMRREYQLEFESHRCGRALAAITNIRSLRSHLVDHQSPGTIQAQNTMNRLISVIAESVTDTSHLGEKSCRIKNHSIGANVHQFSRFSGKSNEPNYGYRLHRNFRGD